LLRHKRRCSIRRPPALLLQNSADEVAARADLNAAVAELARSRGQLNSAQQLFSALQKNDSVQTLFAKHERYLHLRCAQNRKDNAPAMPIRHSNPT